METLQSDMKNFISNFSSCLEERVGKSNLLFWGITALQTLICEDLQYVSVVEWNSRFLCITVNVNK